MSYSLGVDLGTTFSAAAVHESGSTQMVSLGYATTIVPSAVFVTPDGEALVGEAALRRGTSTPDRLAREFKRRIGDSVPLLVGGSPFSAEALTARLLAWIVRTVVEQRGGPPDRLAVTYPANWGPFKQDRLAQAIQLADLPELVGGSGGGRRSELPTVTLTEPEAAAISYAAAERVPAGEVIAVYDLGGGTFDGAVLRKAEVGFEVLGTPEGIEQLGGIDIDEAVFRHVAGGVSETLDQLPADDPAAMRAVARLRQECVEAKEALSSDTDVSVPVVLPGLQTEVRITRVELEAMVGPVLEDTVRALRRTITSADLSPADVDRVLLVGGSSRMPLVAELVTDALERPVFVDAHPKHAVALGAALAAAGVPGLGTDKATHPVATSAVADAEPVAARPDRVAAGSSAEMAGAAGVSPVAEVPVASRLGRIPPGWDSEAETLELGPTRDPLAAPTQELPDSVIPAPGRAPAEAAPELTEPGSSTGTAGRDQPPWSPDGEGATRPPSASPSPSPPSPSERPGPRRLLTAGAVAVLLVVVIVALVLRGGGDDSDPREGPGSTTSSTGTTAPVTPELAVGQSLAVGEFPDGIAVVDGTLVVASTFGGGSVSTIDVASGTVELTEPLDGEPLAVLQAEGSVWVTQRAADTVARIDPTTRQVVATIEAPGKPIDLAFGAGSIWVVGSEGVVTRIDPTDDSRETVLEGLGNLSAVVATDERVWLTHGTNQVGIVDPATNQLTADWAVAGENTDEAVLAESGLWVLNRGEGTVSQLDPDTGDEITRVRVGTEPAGITVDTEDPDRIWVVDNSDGTLVLIHGPTGDVLTTQDVGEKPLAVTTTPGMVWVTLSGANAVVPVTVSGSGAG